MRSCGAVVQRVHAGSRRGNAKPIILVALALFAVQATASAATRDSQSLAGPPSWRLAQASSDSQPNAVAPTPRDDDKAKAEKAGVPATVVDEEQLESVLGIDALSSTGEKMGRIVDIIVDRDGQVRAAISTSVAFSALALARLPSTGARCISIRRRRAPSSPT
jgi:hypothetical protein